MAVLTKGQILRRLTKGDLAFEPGLDEFQLQAHSIDLRLGFSFMIPKTWELTENGRVAINIDPLTITDKKFFDRLELTPGQYFEVLPKEFVVVSSLEKLRIPSDLMAVLYPRSSVNRRGLSVDLTGIIDAGYSGHLIVPIRNNTDSQVIRVYPGERFCQVVFYELSNDAAKPEHRFAENGAFVGLKKENHSEETELIREGKIEKLKEVYKVPTHSKLTETKQSLSGAAYFLKHAKDNGFRGPKNLSSRVDEIVYK